MSHLNRASHEGVALVRLEQDLEEVGRSVLEVVHLRHSSGEVFHGLASAATFQRLVRTKQPKVNNSINFVVYKDTYLPILIFDSNIEISI